MKQPVVSIIIPVFNAIDTVEKCLLSVVNQTYTKREIIVVDGLSSDGTLDVLQKYASDIDKFISARDNGVYDAMNKGIDCASGDFIFFLGADDLLYEVTTLAAIFEDTISDSTKIVFGNVEYYGAKSSKVPTIHQAEFSSALLWKNSMHHQGVFYHRSIFSNFRFDVRFRVLADYDLNLKLLNDSVQAEKKAVIVARCSAGGISKKFDKSLYQEELRIKKQRLSFWNFLIQIPWVWMKYLYKNV